jgi:hypothetical protein
MLTLLLACASSAPGPDPFVYTHEESANDPDLSEVESEDSIASFVAEEFAQFEPTTSFEDSIDSGLVIQESLGEEMPNPALLRRRKTEAMGRDERGFPDRRLPKRQPETEEEFLLRIAKSGEDDKYFPQPAMVGEVEEKIGRSLREKNSSTEY